MQFLFVALFLGVMYGIDIRLPLKGGGGNIVIHDAQFILIRTTSRGFVPELSFVVENQTGEYWQTLKLQFDISGSCKGEPTQWTIPASIFTTTDEHKTTPALDNFGSTIYRRVVMSLIGKLDGCTASTIKPSLVFAENSKIQIFGESGELVEAEKQTQQELKIKRDAEAAAQAVEDEDRRKAAEAQAQKDAIEEARLAKENAEERRRVGAACTAIFRNSVNKKVSDLTVGEAQQVKACQALGLYPPR